MINKYKTSLPGAGENIKKNNINNLANLINEKSNNKNKITAKVW